MKQRPRERKDKRKSKWKKLDDLSKYLQNESESLENTKDCRTKKSHKSKTQGKEHTRKCAKKPLNSTKCSLQSLKDTLRDQFSSGKEEQSIHPVD